MQVLSHPGDVRSAVRSARARGRSVGVVPTMGALHEGHLSLIHRAAAECEVVIATIFVNPTQFGPDEDFDRYPRTLNEDVALCESAGAHLVFAPECDVMYPQGAQTFVTVEDVTQPLEGAVRPGHFRGVTTIVAKLFVITDPDRAYFGQKDYQQQLVIRRMAADLNFPIEIVTCPIVREPDGLALSSRNRYLSPQQRSDAVCLSSALKEAARLAEDRDCSPGEISRRMREIVSAADSVDSVDYALLADADNLEPLETRRNPAVALIAARLGTTRLIDNAVIHFPG